MTRFFVAALSLFFAVEGIWGLFSPVVFGVLTTNTVHAVVHIVLGVWGLYASNVGNPRPFCMIVGTVLLTVGIFAFLPGLGNYLYEWFNMNSNVAVLNVVLGLLTLIMAGRERKADRGEGKGNWYWGRTVKPPL